MQRAARSESINDILRPQIQALLNRSDLSKSDHDRLDQHLTAIRDIEAKMSTTTTITIPDADVATMKTMDPKPYDQSTRDTAVKLFMELMAFSAAADYSRVAVLKIGDRIDDHVYTYNGQSAKFHDVSHRQVANAIPFHNYIDRMMLNYYKYFLDTLSAYTTPTGPLLDQGVAIYCNQCATGAHSFSNIPWIQAGTANGYFKKGQYVVVGNGTAAGRQPGRQGRRWQGLGCEQDVEHRPDRSWRAHRQLRRCVAHEGRSSPRWWPERGREDRLSGFRVGRRPGERPATGRKPRACEAS